MVLSSANLIEEEYQEGFLFIPKQKINLRMIILNYKFNIHFKF